MAASSSKGVVIKLSNANVGTPIDNAGAGGITAITKAKPAIATYTTTGAAPVPGDVIHVKNVGFAELDGKYFIAGPNTTATSLELIGSDTTGSTGTLVTGVTQIASVFHEGTGFTNLCLSNFNITQATPTPINVATFCNPTATIPGNSGSSGTITMAGFVDATSDDYKLLLKADEDRLERVLSIKLPGANGHLIAVGTVGSVHVTVPLAGAIGYECVFTLATKPAHAF